MKLEELAQHVRTLYIQHRRHWEETMSGRPSSYSPAAKWDRFGPREEPSAWLKLAKYLQQHQLPPDEYLAVQFATPRLVNPLQPNQLTGATALERWKNRPQIADAFGRLWHSQLGRFTTETLLLVGSEGLSPCEAAVHVICGQRQALELSPLFCCCMLVCFDLQDANVRKLLKVLLPAARQQYQQNPQNYDQEWANYLTPQLLRWLQPAVTTPGA